MTTATTDNPSQHEANKMVRVLSGKRLKYTVRLHLQDSRIIEWQSDERATIKWHDEARALWICSGGYDNRPMMPWPDGAMMLSEENPKD